MAQRKGNTQSVARTASSATLSIRDELINLAVEYTTTETIRMHREAIKEQQGGKYQQLFQVAKRCNGLDQFTEHTDSVKQHMKNAGQNIDRTYSNAVSAIKRYWKMWVKHEGMEVKVDKKGNTVTLRKSIKEVPTFHMLKAAAEGAKKALETNGSFSDASLNEAWARLDVKLRHAHPETARKAIDAALAYFLAGGTAKPTTKGKVKQAKAEKDSNTSAVVVGQARRRAEQAQA